MEKVLYKRCPKCSDVKEISEFYKDRSTTDGYSCWCNACRKESRNSWIENNRPAHLLRLRNAHLKRKFGITHTDYENMLKEQNGGCALCKSPTPGGDFSHFTVDHDHSTEKVRKLLCNNCNLLVGFAETNLSNIFTIAKYVCRGNIS